MQTVCSTTFKGTALTRPSRSSVVAPRTVSRGPVVCKADSRPVMAAAAAVPALLASHPALAVVDQRLGGEGTSKILGVSSLEFWPILIVFGAIWALYYSAGKELDKNSRGSGDDEGLSL